MIPTGYNAMAKSRKVGKLAYPETIYFHQKCWTEKQLTGKDRKPGTWFDRATGKWRTG